MRFWPLKLAFRYLFPRQRWGTFFTWISILGITIGVALLTVVLSIMNGFDKNIAQKLMQINGPIKILASKPIYTLDQLSREICKVKHVEAITPFVQGVCLLQHQNHVAFPKCIGLDVDTATSVLPLQSFLQKGNLLDLKESVFISSALANDLRLSLGDTFEVYSPLSLEAIKNDEIILPQTVTVGGIFKTGWAEIDRDTLLLPLHKLQELYGLNDQVHGFSLMVDDKFLASTRHNLNEILPAGIHAYTWNELNEDFLYILKLEKLMCFFVLLFIVAVAAFSMSSGLMTAVIRKQREISLLKIWGASRYQIASIFCLQSFFLGILGLLSGFLIAGITLHYRNAILQCLTGWIFPKDMLWNFYDVEMLPVAYCYQDFIAIAIFSILITFIASLLPILRAIRLHIIQGLRSE